MCITCGEWRSPACTNVNGAVRQQLVSGCWYVCMSISAERLRCGDALDFSVRVFVPSKRSMWVIWTETNMAIVQKILGLDVLCSRSLVCTHISPIQQLYGQKRIWLLSRRLLD